MSNDIIEYELLGEDDPSLLIAMEPLWRGMADELQELHYLKGVKFVNQLKLIVYNGKFQAVDNESNIFSALNEQSPDYENLLNAARKAVEHGYRVYILPNPKGIRTADFIFVRKNIYRLYDLKTIHGKSSVLNRLMESIGQTNHVLLNLSTDYPATSLARSIKKYFERNTDAAQVLIFRGNKVMSVTRKTLEDRNFIATFTKLFYK
jgi:phosphoheptose isomerase